MKKIIIHFPAALLIFLSLNSCVNQKQKDEEQIKETVTKYWQAVKENNIDNYKNLFVDSESFAGGIQADLYFLHKNYDRINSNDVLLKEIKVKDTVVRFEENKQKYVQYIIKKENDTSLLKKPLIITLMFYKPAGLNKIFYPSPLRNHIGWDK